MAFDLDAFIADHVGEPFPFTFGGGEFTWPGAVDLRVTGLLAEGKLFEALEQLNGDQHEQFMEAWKAHAGVLDTKVVTALFGEHAKHCGSSLGILGLWRLLEEHPEALEADLQAHYQVDLAGLVTGKLSWRRLGVLVRHLPPTSSLARAQHGDVVRWGDSEYLLAGIFDLLAGANWQRGGGKGSRPRPMKRPGDKGTTRYGKVVSLSEARRRLAKATGVVMGQGSGMVANVSSGASSNEQSSRASL